jgi:hypothetical protein
VGTSRDDREIDINTNFEVHAHFEVGLMSTAMTDTVMHASGRVENEYDRVISKSVVCRCEFIVQEKIARTSDSTRIPDSSATLDG